MASIPADRRIISLGDNLLLVDFEYGTVINLPSYLVGSFSITHEFSGRNKVEFDVLAYGQPEFLHGERDKKMLKQVLKKRAILEMLDSEDLLAELHRRSAERGEVITDAKRLLPSQG